MITRLGSKPGTVSSFGVLQRRRRHDFVTHVREQVILAIDLSDFELILAISSILSNQPMLTVPSYQFSRGVTLLCHVQHLSNC